MYIKIHKMELQKNQYWNDLLISRIWLYEDNWDYVRRVKLSDPEIVTLLLNNKIWYDKGL